MSDQKKRVIVDGVEFGELFHFPRILGAVTSSLQPPRLIIGLLMVAALVTGGRLWDWAVEPTIPPEGLTGEEYTAEDRNEHIALMREALLLYRDYYVPRQFGGTQDAEDWEPWTRSEPTRVLDEVKSGYESDRNPDLPNINQSDAEYDSYVRRIREGAPSDPYDAMADYAVANFHRVVQGVVYLNAREVIGGMGDLLIRLPRGMWTHARWFTIVYGLFALLVLAIGGGALSRMAAVQVAGQERMRIRNAIDFAAGNWVKLVLAPMLPLIILFAIGLVITVCGAIMNWPVLNAIGGFGYGIFLLLGILLSFLLLAYAFGFPMLIPAVACENCDAGDSMTRTFNYILVRPLHYVGYAITGLAGLAVGFIIVGFFAVLTLKVTGSLFGLFTNADATRQLATDVTVFDLTQGPVEESSSRLETWAASGIAFWQMIVISLVSAYVLVYFFSASTTVYLLMRRACDGQDVEEIWWPGLMPGTLAPMPRTRVEFAGEAIAESIRRGRGEDDEPDDDAGRSAPAADAGSPTGAPTKKTSKKAKSKKKTKTSKASKKKSTGGKRSGKKKT